MLRRPDVVFNQRYHRRYSKDFTKSKRYLNKGNFYDKQINHSNFFFCSQNYDVCAYMSRDEAADKEDVIEGRMREQGFDSGQLIAYMKDRPGSCGLFDENGSLTERDYQYMQRFMATVPNTGWSCFMSFTKDFSDEYCNNPYEAQKILKNVIPKQLKLQGLNPNDFTWFGAYHTNTENRHIHFVIVPLLGSKKFKAMTSRETLTEIRRMIIQEYPLKNRKYSLDRDLFLKEFDKAYEAAMPALTAQAFNVISSKKQYERLTKDERETINSFAWGVVNSSPELKEHLKIIKDWTYKLTENGYEKSDLWFDFARRIYNRTMKHMTEQAKRDNIKSLSEEKEFTTTVRPINRRKIIKTSKTRKMIRKKHGTIANFLKQLAYLSAQESVIDFENDCARAWREIEKEMEEEQFNEEEIGETPQFHKGWEGR